MVRILKKSEVIIIAAAIFIATAVITALLYNTLPKRLEFMGAEKVDTIKASFEVGDRVGLNVDNDALNFGIILPGGGSKRSINVSNTHPYTIMVKLYKTGNISNFLHFDETTYVTPNEAKEIFFNVGVPSNASSGKYSGEIKIAFFPS